MIPNQRWNNCAEIATELTHFAYLLLVVTSFCLCIYCLDKGKDLAAAYWALVSLLAPQIEGWFQERE
jgi:hypothetical protein